MDTNAIIVNFLRKTGSVILNASQLLENSSKKNTTLVRKGPENRDLYLTKEGHYFWLDKKVYLDRCIIDSGVFEPTSTALVKKIVKKGDVVLDIGANIGYYSVLLSKIVGEKGKILCFEPTSCYQKTLNLNLSANKISNVEVYRFGLSDEKKKLTIYIGECSATMHPAGNNSTGVTEEIELLTLDEFIMDSNLKRIDFIKIDVDGHEPLFFNGAWRTLDQYDPIILLEISHLHYKKAGFTAWDFYESITKRGYLIYDDNLSLIHSEDEFLIKCGNFAYSSNIVISKRKIENPNSDAS
jgi:FkbM family methyltransferase